MKIIISVYIIFKVDSWLVCYVGRRKGQWSTAASFYAKDHSLEWVKEWVLNQPNYKLVEDQTVGNDWQDTGKQFQAV